LDSSIQDQEAMQKPQRLNARNAQHPTRPQSSQERASICEAIQRELALEYFLGTNARREVWARISIGLRPFPRSIYREQRR
jgi:hypothetical protein